MGSRFEIKELGDPLFDELTKCRGEIGDARALLKTSKG